MRQEQSSVFVIVQTNWAKPAWFRHQIPLFALNLPFLTHNAREGLQELFECFLPISPQGRGSEKRQSIGRALSKRQSFLSEVSDHGISVDDSKLRRKIQFAQSYPRISSFLLEIICSSFKPNLTLSLLSITAGTPRNQEPEKTPRQAVFSCVLPHLLLGAASHLCHLCCIRCVNREHNLVWQLSESVTFPGQRYKLHCGKSDSDLTFFLSWS